MAFVNVTINISDDTTKSVSENNNNCSICLCKTDCNALTTLKCGHTYHTDCYTSFLAYNIVNNKDNIACPICRDNIIQIVVDKSNTVQITTEENQIQSTQHTRNNRRSFCSEFSCRILPFGAKIMMLYLLFLAIYYSVHCSQSQSC